MTIDEFIENAGYYDERETSDAKSYDVLFAAFDKGSYDGSLYSILRKNGLLFEYEDSHCSCNGFEFNPTPVTAEYLVMRIDKGDFPYCLDGQGQKEELISVVNALRPTVSA